MRSRRCERKEEEREEEENVSDKRSGECKIIEQSQRGVC